MVMLPVLEPSVANSPIGATKLAAQDELLTVQVPAEHEATAVPLAPATVFTRLAEPPELVAAGTAEQKLPAPQLTDDAGHWAGADVRISTFAPPQIQTP